jgi:prepilin-type N-terminal cleavage/methylation domain-containing protein
LKPDPGARKPPIPAKGAPEMKAHDPIARLARSGGFTLIEIMIVVCILGILIGIATPTWIRQREVSQTRSCQENLTKIAGAKEQWAMENNKTAADTPDWSDLYASDGSSYLKTMPACPAGGDYTLNTINENPTCSITVPDHNADPRDHTS